MSYYLNVFSNSACVYNLADYKNLNRNEKTWNSGEVIDNEIKGKYSKKSKKRFTSIIKSWLSVIESINYFKGSKGDKIDSHLRFVTLTLSAKQAHDDYFIRRYMLGRFIRDIKERFNVINYLYCSEAQKNGNIHFHILIDNYINYKQIQTLWNNIQDTYGYIDKFYEKHGHKEPNSTDIRRLNKAKNVANYLVKYFTKDENRRLIKGRLWGSSDNLKKIKHYVVEVGYHEAMLFNQIKEQGTKRMYSGDYFTLINNLSIGELDKFNVVIQLDVMTFYFNQVIYLNGLADRIEPLLFEPNKKIFHYVNRYAKYMFCEPLYFSPHSLSYNNEPRNLSQQEEQVFEPMPSQTSLKLSFLNKCESTRSLQNYQ